MMQIEYSDNYGRLQRKEVIKEFTYEEKTYYIVTRTRGLYDFAAPFEVIEQTPDVTKRA
jgi:hypothetical protein